MTLVNFVHFSLTQPSCVRHPFNTPLTQLIRRSSNRICENFEVFGIGFQYLEEIAQQWQLCGDLLEKP
jgi:hypothetical protein